MIDSLLHHINEKVLPPQESWWRTCVIALGVGSGALFSLKLYLSSRRGYCMNSTLLTGKTCIVTGANTGIGKAVALEFAKRQAHVILACRDLEKGHQASLDIKNYIHHADVIVYKLDLASQDSVRNFVEDVKVKEGAIDVLVNNAGLMGCPYSLSKDGIEIQFAVNHLGHFLLTTLLLEKMKKEDSRIIVVGSSLYKHATLDLMNYNQREGYLPQLAYAHSKLANLLFVHELKKRLPEGITVNGMHPGVVRTELGRYRLTNPILKFLFNILGYFLLRTPKEGAQTILYLATEPSLRTISGKYFGDCKMEEVTDAAKDDKLAEKLWELSELLTKPEDEEEEGEVFVA